MKTQPWRVRLRSWWWLIPALAVVFPLLRLLPLDAHFAIDWYNHKWLAAYSGEYLRQHGTVPVVLNTTEYAGVPYPIFYGTLLYPALSTLTSWIHPGVVIRLVVLLVTWMQFHMVSRALVRLDVPIWISRGIACLTIWAIYPLTNLYNRSAFTEYVATGLLSCTLATWFLLLHAEKPAERTRLSLGFGLLFALTAGIHPITALYSLPILALLLVAAYDEHGRDPAFWKGLVKALALPVGLTVVVLAPWVYALRLFKPYLMVSSSTAGQPWFYTASIDHWKTRFFPIPYDSRTNDLPVEKVESAFLDAQINLPLLILLVGLLAILLWRNRAAGVRGLRSAAFGLAAFVFFTWISLSPSAYNYLPSFARLLQIAYRAITYQNLSVLLGLFMLAAFLRRGKHRLLVENRRAATGLLLGCLALSSVGVVIKFDHASAIMKHAGPSSFTADVAERESWVGIAPSFYGAGDYSAGALYTQFPPEGLPYVREERIPIGTGSEFGVPGPLRVSLPSETWVGTNVQAFPWNKVEIDGTVAPKRDLRVLDRIRFAVRVPAGDHTLTMRTTPATTWLVLRGVSFAVLALWFGLVAFLNVRAWRRARSAPAVT